MPAKIETVLGPIEPSSAGITLTHEHLSLNFEIGTVPPSNPKDEAMRNCPFTMENLGWIRQNPMSHKYNLTLSDPESHAAVLQDVQVYKQYGGRTIVENTTTGIQRNLPFLEQVAKETGVNIITGTGYYVAGSQTPSALSLSVEALANEMRQELTVGCSGTSIKCGFIGELGSVFPIHDFEKKVLQAAAITQIELDCPVMIHPHRYHEAPAEALRVFTEAGGNPKRTVMAHLDRTLFEHEALSEFASLGTFLELDMFGIEVSYYQSNPKVDMTSDADRIRMISHLIKEGYEDRIMISHDVYSKHRLIKFGGHGYCHILRNAVPKMLTRGIPQSVIDKILIDNPKEWLTWG